VRSTYEDWVRQPKGTLARSNMRSTPKGSPSVVVGVSTQILAHDHQQPRSLLSRPYFPYPCNPFKHNLAPNFISGSHTSILVEYPARAALFAGGEGLRNGREHKCSPQTMHTQTLETLPHADKPVFLRPSPRVQRRNSAEEQRHIIYPPNQMHQKAVSPFNG